jgi:hypothetical protein
MMPSNPVSQHHLQSFRRRTHSELIAKITQDFDGLTPYEARTALMAWLRMRQLTAKKPSRWHKLRFAAWLKWRALVGAIWGNRFASTLGMLAIVALFALPLWAGTVDQSKVDAFRAKPIGIRTIDVGLEAPETTDDLYFKNVYGTMHLMDLDCVAIGTTTPGGIVKVQECSSAGASCADTGFQVVVVALDTNYNDTDGTDEVVDRGDWLKLEIQTMATVPEWLFCTISFTAGW